MTLSPTQLYFTADSGSGLPPSTSFQISVTAGSGTFHTWSVVDNATWLSESPTSGSGMTPFSRSVDVQPVTTAMSPGTYSADIEVSCTGVTNSPDTVSVIYQVTASWLPSMNVVPDQLLFTSDSGGALPLTSSFQISVTAGSGTFHSWSLTDDASWLGETPTSGSSMAPFSQSIDVQPNSNVYSPGMYVAGIEVSCSGVNNSPDTVEVVWVVEICCQIRGDVNNSGDPVIDISDLVYLVNYMFLYGPTPNCIGNCDLNGSGGVVDISDLVYLVNYMYLGGSVPVPCP